MDKNQNLVTILTILLIVAAFFLGSLSTKVKYLEQGAPILTTNPTAVPNQPQTQVTPQPTPKVTLSNIEALFTGKNITFGDKNNKNLIVEVADPSCPYCHVAGGHNPELSKQIGTQFTYAAEGGTYMPPVPEIKKLIDQGLASFVWIYSPGHGNGEMGTKAFYCAYEKDKDTFWRVHDKLMTNEAYTLLNDKVKNDKTKSQELADFVSDVIDPVVLKECLDSNKYDAKLTEDIALAAKIGIQGTPGFFINETKFSGAYSWNDMKSAVK